LAPCTWGIDAHDNAVFTARPDTGKSHARALALLAVDLANEVL